MSPGFFFFLVCPEVPAVAMPMLLIAELGRGRTCLSSALLLWVDRRTNCGSPAPSLCSQSLSEGVALSTPGHHGT